MSEQKDREGKCISCGFLAKFDAHYEGPPPYIYEMPPRGRDTGEVSGIRLWANREILGFPQCYANVANLWGEIDSATRAGGMDRFAAAREVFSKERHCAKWHQYTPGFSPQQHLEEERMLELELKRQQFEKQMADDQKASNRYRKQACSADLRACSRRDRCCRDHRRRASGFISSWFSLASKSIWHQAANTATFLARGPICLLSVYVS